jgi:hypothetical protein
MTGDLKHLMDRATTRPDAFVPDAAGLVDTARRRQRKRRLTGSLTALAAVIGLVAGGTVALKLHGDETPVAAKPSDYRLCTLSTGRAIKGAWSWQPEIEVKDKYGTASVRRAPGSSRQWAFCISQPSYAPHAPLGARGGVLLRKSPISDTSSMTTVFGPTYDGGGVMVQTDRDIGHAEVKNGFYIYRHVDARPWPGPTPTATVQLQASNGTVTAVGRW